MREKKIDYVDPTGLLVGENVRASVSLNIPVMSRSIEREGIHEALIVRKIDEGLRVVRGHRRLAGVLDVLAREPDAYAKHFPNGIPVIVRKDIVTDEAEALLKADHGTQQQLTLNCELFRTVKLLLDEDCTEKVIVAHCEGLFLARSKSMPSAKREEIAALRADDPVKNAAKIQELLLETYRGKMQGLRAIWACPAVVAASLEWAETNVVPEGFEAKDLYKGLKAGNVKSLLKAFQADMELVDGVPAFSKEEPGPSFDAAWHKVSHPDPKDKKDGPRSKGMSSKELEDQLMSGKFSSQGMRSITAEHAGQKGMKGIAAADASLYLVEIAKKHSPTLWANFKEAAQAIVAGLKKAKADK